MPYTVALADEAATRLEGADGKGAALARLAQNGFCVPGGFVVTTEAFRAHTDDPALREQLGALDDLDVTSTNALKETAAVLREAVTACALPDEVRTAIEEALAGKDAAYAVRSSATAEDLPGASFAGQHETSLNVRGAAAVLEKIRACMSSLFTDRAVAYRARNGIPNMDVEMAVVVQEMAGADAAGILFTADPDTGKRCVAALEAVRGLGEALVSGAAPSDHARIDRASHAVLSYETAAENGERVLSNAQVQQLARLGGEVERLFEGVPQDIEWSLAGEQFHVLQARPITTLTPLPEPYPTDGRLHVYMSMGHAQAMAAPMPPLALDLWASVYGDMLNNLTGGRRAWVTRTNGRAYLDITPMLGFKERSWRASTTCRRLPA